MTEQDKQNEKFKPNTKISDFYSSSINDTLRNSNLQTMEFINF